METTIGLIIALVLIIVGIGWITKHNSRVPRKKSK
jgi:hypothetical protein